jgi:3-carboxy-cis,cis-muconate cycloisomerase
MTTFSALFIPPDLARTVSDQAWLAAMLDAERALANAEAIAGVIPAQAAARIAEHCRADEYDIVQLCRDGRAAGNPAEPLVRALRAAVGPEAGGFVHWGATSQDIIDSAAMLVSDRALRLIVGWLDAAEAACARLAREHRSTPMAGRTLLQQAVPTTFGLKAAGWLTGMRDARTLVMRVRDERLCAQLGGGVGSLSALGARAAEVRRLYAHELDLCDPQLPWHTNRIALIEIGAALAAVTAAAAKIGSDIVLLAQTEVGELAEGAGGGSSTMPHKHNPTASVCALACATRARDHCARLVAAAPNEHERAAGAWHAEWDALSEALATAGGAIAAIATALPDLRVDPHRMRANLDLTGGLILSERVAFAAAQHAGLDVAHELVTAAAARASAGGVSFRDALVATDALGLTADQIDAQLDPTAGLESAEAMVDRALGHER